MRPEYGSLLHRLVFAPNDDTTAGLAIHYVRQALARWEPRVEVLDVDAGADPDAPEQLVITLRYRVRASQAEATLTIPVELSPHRTPNRRPRTVTLRLPDLDDRTFTQLVDEARRRIEATCPDWTDLTPHDPGMTLIEVFAHLTEVMLYRLNRLPEKAYVAFLNLLGVQRLAPVAASVVLEFRRDREGDDPITIPGGHPGHRGRRGQGRPGVRHVRRGDPGRGRAVGDRVGPPLRRGRRRARRPGQRRRRPDLHRRPAAPGPDRRRRSTCWSAWQALPGELEEGAPAREWQGTTFRIWEPVWSFAGQAPGAHVYVVDRAEGRITFAPAVDPGPPPASRRPAPRRLRRRWWPCRSWAGTSRSGTAPGAAPRATWPRARSRPCATAWPA